MMVEKKETGSKKRNPIVIAIANQKGGEGKTTTAINLAYGLAKSVNRILVIDLDPQSNTTSVFSSKNGSAELSMKNVFAKTARLSKIILKSQYDNLNLAPSSIGLAEIETSIFSVEAPYILRDAIAQLVDKNRENYNYIVIDCPPTLSVFTINALVAATHVLIPAQAEKFSVDGMAGLQKTINSIKNRINPNLQVIGVLITQLKKNTLLNKTVLPIISQFYPVFNQTISQGISVGESHLAGKAIHDYAPKSRQAKEYLIFVKEFIDELKS